MYVIVWLSSPYLDYAEYEHQGLALTCVTLIFKRGLFLYFLFTFFGFLNPEDGPDRLSRNLGKK